MATVEAAVKERYGQGAKAQEAALCCPVDYDPKYLKIIPEEIIEKDYGCGDPSKHIKQGETVLDLGSGGGKICYIASQVVGESGKVIGVDMTDDMLELANKYKSEIAEKIGYQNVEFRKGYIQDLQLNLASMEDFLAKNPINSPDDYQKLQSYIDEQKKNQPLVASDSIDVIVSNCVLNLVDTDKKEQMFSEMFRVLKRGGRCVISDIVSDEVSPQHLQENEELWSGCISGAFQEHEFLKAFENAGFHGVEILSYDENPWQIIEGIEYKSMTVVAYKGKQGPCLERNQAVIYKGPWKSVTDDDGHTLYRGERMAVCDKTYHIYQSAAYAEDILAIEPKMDIPLNNAKSFDCRKNARRDPRESKGNDYNLTTYTNAAACDPNSGCC
jgi:ubiquinone/menaquinone biosynthesis C-methylase UbiE